MENLLTVTDLTHEFLEVEAADKRLFWNHSCSFKNVSILKSNTAVPVLLEMLQDQLQKKHECADAKHVC